MTRVSVAIMAHPSREAFVPELLAKLDREATVVWDQRNDRWDTGRRSLLAYDPDATHHLVVQDDAIIPHDLVAGIEQGLGHVPAKSPLCLYAGRVKPFRDTVQQLIDLAGDAASWLAMSQCHWGVGIVMPTQHIKTLVAWGDGRSDIPNYDTRISRWCQHQGLTVFYPWPSLVDHRDSPSLVPNRGSAGRRAYRFLGADKSALNVDWSKKTVAIAQLGGVQQAHPQTSKGPRMKFVSRKYLELQVAPARIRFRGGVAETSRKEAVAILMSPAVRALGVEPVQGNSDPDAVATETGTASEAQPAQAKLTAFEHVWSADEVEAAGGQAVEAMRAVASGNAEETEEPGDDTQPRQVADPDTVPDGNAKDVLTWVGEDPARARQALEVEESRDKPRSTLAATLTKLAN